MYLFAAFQRWFTQRSHGCQGNRISFRCTSVHQRVRDRTDESHVDSEADAKVQILCSMSIERWRLAQASQVLESLRPEVLHHCEATVLLRRSAVQRTGSATMYEYMMTV